MQKSIQQDKKSRFALLDMEQWTIIVRQWDRTKENQQEYCKRLNLNINTFSYVRSKLNTKNKSANKFIPLTIQSSSSWIDSSSPLIIENRSGMKLHLPLSLKKNELINLLTIIGWHHA